MITNRNSVRVIVKVSSVLLTLTLFILLCANSAKLNTKNLTASAPAQERKAEIERSRHIPTFITSVRNLNKENWLESLEIEIKNVFQKPIYFLSIDVLFPDIPKSTELDGIPRGMAIPLMYGRPELMQHGHVANSEDVPIPQGEKYVFRIPEANWKGLQMYLSERKISASIIKRIRVRVNSISFGDGTGYVGGGPFSFNERSALDPSQVGPANTITEAPILSISHYRNDLSPYITYAYFLTVPVVHATYCSYSSRSTNPHCS